MKHKEIKFSFPLNEKLWVGNGFHVHPMIRPTKDLYPYTDPFILMDYASPKEFAPTQNKLGVGEHPHKGFETVTFALQGEVEHRDSSGGHGVIKQGGVQWMTAGKGLVHEEFHSRDFAQQGGVFEMIQLWVNLPKKDKLVSPRYQDLQKEDFPIIEEGNSQIKVITGKYKNTTGPAQTYSEMNIYEVSGRGKSLNLALEENTTTVLLLTKGKIKLEGQTFQDKQLLVFDRPGTSLDIEFQDEVKLVLLNAKPLNEEIVAQGPFVMNTKEEIIKAISEYHQGLMGSLN